MNKKKIAFISGIGGQDGCYLAEKLLKKGFVIYGGERRSASNQYWRLKEKNIYSNINFVDFELLEFNSILNVLSKIKPNLFFNLAAQSFVASSFENPIYTFDATGTGVLKILEAIRLVSKKTKFIQASSSEMFGSTGKLKGYLNEKSIFYPRSPYAIAKLAAHHSVINYREAYGLHCSNCIMFNHESPFRGEEFVTKKIVKGIVNWKHTKKILELGNLYSTRDWGHASDYMDAMIKMILLKQPGDYVISTGKNYSVKDFINKALDLIDIKYKWKYSGTNEVCLDTKGNIIIKINKKFFRPAEVSHLRGNSKKFINLTNWKPKYDFNGLVEDMVNYEIKSYKKSE